MKKTLCAVAVFAAVTLTLGNGTASAFTLNDYNKPDAVQLVITGLTSFGSTDYGHGPMGTGETWGIFKVTTIQSTDGNSTMHWQQYQDDEQIYGIVYGLFDNWIDGTGPYDIHQIGGSFDLFISTTTDHSMEYKTNQGPAGRFAQNGYNTVTNIVGAKSFLSGNFVPGIAPADPNTTVLQVVTSASSPATGVGSGYGVITGGDYSSYFGGDIFVDFAVKNGAKNGWSQVITGNIYPTPVPVPGTLLLLGSGLAGLFGMRRKNNV